jgi:hypothetical protein
MGNRVRQRIAGVVITVWTILGAPELSRAEIPTLLQKLNLTGYPRVIKPRSSTAARPMAGQYPWLRYRTRSCS